MSDIFQSRTDVSDEAIEAAQRLAAIVESSDDAIISKDLNGIVKSWNKGAERIFGYSASEAIGQSITLVIPPEFHEQEPLILGRIAKGERVERFETIRQRKDGSQFHISVTVSPIRDRDGRIIGASKIGRDISDLRLSQERQELLLREMVHRVKNLFAVASGVVALSARGASSARELAHAVQSRLVALSRAHELILPQGDAGAKQSVSLGELVQTILSPYDAADQRITIDGPPGLECGPSASSSFALLLHEFATNSVKYGALSEPDGRIAIDWKETGDSLLLAWTEKTASRSGDGTSPLGFGTFLVDATARSLSAEVTRSWQDGSLRITFEVPLARLRE